MKYLLLTIFIFACHTFLPLSGMASTKNISLNKNSSIKFTKKQKTQTTYKFLANKGDLITVQVKSLQGENPIITALNPKGEDISSECIEKHPDPEEQLNKCSFVHTSWKKKLTLDGSYQISLYTMEPSEIEYEITIIHQNKTVKK